MIYQYKSLPFVILLNIHILCDVAYMAENHGKADAIDKIHTTGSGALKKLNGLKARKPCLNGTGSQTHGKPV